MNSNISLSNIGKLYKIRFRDLTGFAYGLLDTIVIYRQFTNEGLGITKMKIESLQDKIGILLDLKTRLQIIQTNPFNTTDIVDINNRQSYYEKNFAQLYIVDAKYWISLDSLIKIER